MIDKQRTQVEIRRLQQQLQYVSSPKQGQSIRKEIRRLQETLNAE